MIPFLSLILTKIRLKGTNGKILHKRAFNLRKRKLKRNGKAWSSIYPKRKERSLFFGTKSILLNYFSVVINASLKIKFVQFKIQKPIQINGNQRERIKCQEKRVFTWILVSILKVHKMKIKPARLYFIDEEIMSPVYQ